MASQSVPVPFGDSRSSAHPRLSAHAPSVRAAFIVVITIAILFRWLHLFLALQVTSTGRQIQLRTDELQQKERAVALLQEQIAVAESPQSLAIRASFLGYAPCTPLYITLDEPVSATAQESTGIVGAEGTSGGQLDPLRAFDTWLVPALGP